MSSATRVTTYHPVKYAEDYSRRGFATVPVPAGRKGPNLEGWPNLRLTPDDVPRYFGAEPVNVGLILGEPSGWLTDVDLDVEEAVVLADEFLPRTATSGREGSPRSHRWFRSPGTITERFKDTDGKMLVELRSTGVQTLVEPSIHPDGERYLWNRSDGAEMTEVDADDLREAVKKIATATILARHLPEGGRHDYALAAAGYLLRPGRLDEETVLKIMLEGWRSAGGDSPEAIRDIEGIVRDTARKLDGGESVVGGPTLDDLVPGMVGTLARWWGWRGENRLPVADFTPSPPPPKLQEEALHGLAGEIVRTVEPHSEADPVALLTNTLVSYGNAIGRGSFVRVESDTHFLKLFAALVGRTSKGRKGTSWGHAKRMMAEADPEWTDSCIISGMSSGEGLVNRVRDANEVEDDGEACSIPLPPPKGKRLLVMEPELAQALKVMKREGNTLSPVVRQSWDDARLESVTKGDPMRASSSHISIMGHITKEELVRHLTETELANGFANRFLWVVVERSKELPFGGNLRDEQLAPLVRRLDEAVRFGKGAGEITWGESSREAWRQVYGPLSEGKAGLFGAVTGRAEAQVMRLAALYAVLDFSKTIELAHLMAALAFWQYVEGSVRYIFGDATGDPLADRIYSALASAGAAGITRTDIRDVFAKNKAAVAIEKALDTLLRDGRAWCRTERTAGRPAQRWFAK